MATPLDQRKPFRLLRIARELACVALDSAGAGEAL